MSAIRYAASIVLGLSVLGSPIALGQTFPSKVIRIYTSDPGGTLDFATRIVAQGLTESLKQQVIVENRPGILAADIAVKAAPDGHTLHAGSAVVWFAPILQDNLAWDPVKDFVPITIVAKSPNVLVVPSSFAVNSVKELIALARAKPGTINYASGSLGGTIHLGGELFRSLANIDVVRVPYKGEGAALTALMSGELQLMFSTAGASIPLIKSGRIKGLAVTSADPFPLIPGLPTLAASGVPGYELLSYVAMSAPAKTPPQVINQINQEIVRIMHKEDVKEKFANVGVQTVGSTPEELAALVKSEISRLGKFLKESRTGN